jgi:hypothetical protein
MTEHATVPTDEDPLSLDDWPAHLCDSYARMVLISENRHLAGFDKNDPTTLFVSSDWLLWQLLSRQGYHCVFIEQGYVPAPDATEMSMDILLRGNDWVYHDERDITDFHGVSLGRGFSTPAALFIATYVRFSNALDNLIDRFEPDEMVYFDLVMFDTVITSAWARHYVASKISERRNLRFVDRGDPGVSVDTDIRNVRRNRPVIGWLRRVAIAFYCTGMGAVSRVLSRIIRPRNRVLLMMGWNLFEPIAFGENRGTQALVHASAFPKSLKAVFRFFAHGFLLGDARQTPLGRADLKKLDKIRGDLEVAWAAQPATDLQEALREFVRREILSNGRLHEMAVAMKTARKFLDRYTPDRLVVDGVKNLPPYAYIETCHALAIPVDYIWHAPVAPQNLKLDALGCDPRVAPRVQRILSWGSANEDWLRAISARIAEVVDVGNPILGRYQDSRKTDAAQQAAGQPNSALVVQQTCVFTDLKACLSSQYYQFVHAVRRLRQNGIENIVFKLHPGIPRGYEMFTAIADAFGLDCAVERFGRFDKFVRNADVVIGPLVSGSALETASAGVNFIPLFLEPTSLDFTYYGGINHIQKRIGDIDAALTAKHFLDNEGYIEIFGGALKPQERTAKFWGALEA